MLDAGLEPLFPDMRGADWIDTDLTFIWDRVNSPLTTAEGVTPEPDDFRVTFGFGIDF